MIILPSPFPLLASDQADVIEIFHELMRQSREAAHAEALMPQEPVTPPSDACDPTL